MRSRPWTIAGIFVVSGAAALVYQVVWMRQLTLLFGATVHAVSTILAAFMGGLALGAYLGGRIAVGSRDPGRTYALLELAIAGLGGLSVPVFDQLPAVVAGLLPRELTGAPDVLARFALAVPLLLLPTALMGATLPVLIRHVAREDVTAARYAGFLYTGNTLGACLGAAAAGYFLIPTLGMRGTVSVAVLLNVGAGIAGYAATRRGERPSESLEDTPALPRERVQPLWLGYAFVTGLSALALEVLWTRALVLYLGSSVYAYASMLTVYLLGLAVGGAVGVRMLATSVPPARLLAGAQLLLAFDLPLLIWQFGRLDSHINELRRLIGSGGYGAFTAASYLAISEMLLPPTLLIGVSLPVLMAVVTRSARGAPREVGTLYAYNTVGSIVGSVGAPLLLIPALGIQRSLLVLAVGSLLLCAVALLGGSPRRPGLVIGSMLAVGLAFGGLYHLTCPSNAVVLAAGVFGSESTPTRLVALEEDVDATVTVQGVEQREGEEWYSLEVNGVNVAGTAPDLVAIQKLQGHLPLLLAGQRGSVLHIGFGSGGTAYAVSRHPVDEITIAELSLGVIRVSDRYFRSVNRGVLHDPRVRVVHRDGRNYLLSAGAPFDVILSDSIHPRYSGNGALYSREYYQRCRDQLRPGGVVSMWLPIYSLTPSNYKAILKAFHDVFPETSVWYVNSTVNPFTIVIGHTTPFRIDLEELRSRMAEPEVAADLAQVGVRYPLQLLDYFFFAGDRVAEYTGAVNPHVDDLPVVEYESMLIVNRQASWAFLFRELLPWREPVLPWVEQPDARTRAALKRAYDATSRSLEGHALMLAGRVDEAQEAFAEARRMNPDDPDPVAW